LLNSVPKESVKEVWKIISYMIPNSYQHVVILSDGTHLCTCLLLVSHGVICRHYFKLMIENSSALFHILLMPTRWLKDDAWNQIDLISNEPFIGTSSKNLKSTNDNSSDLRIYPIPNHHNNIQEVEIRHHTQKKVYYGRIMGHFKQALNYSLEDNDQENLDNIILTYIAEKELKQQNKTQSVKRKTLKDNNDQKLVSNELRMSDGHVYNINDIEDPIKRQGKGRPSIKRLKTCNEQKGTDKVQKKNVYEGDNSGGRKCRLCHKAGHYAPKCPNKENNHVNNSD
jgi:hypothetical protein